MPDLDQLESQSVYILREAFNKIDRLALLWSIGKDSNVLLWLVRKAFFGRVPFPVVQLDTGMELPEV
jgi:sulfate adenylyltransferase subunit 2